MAADHMGVIKGLFWKDCYESPSGRDVLMAGIDRRSVCSKENIFQC